MKKGETSMNTMETAMKTKEMYGHVVLKFLNHQREKNMETWINRVEKSRLRNKIAGKHMETLKRGTMDERHVEIDKHHGKNENQGKKQ